MASHRSARQTPARQHATPTPRARKKPDPGAPCPLMHECGGCAWISRPYRKQLARKQASMEELFTPLISRSDGSLQLEPIRGMGGTVGDGALPAPRGFRHKASTPFAPGPHHTVRCGFYAPGTHRIIPVDDCPVEAPGARRILNGVARLAEELGIPAYHEDTHRGELRYAVLRMGWKRDEALLTVVTRNRDIAHLHEFVEGLRALDPRIVSVAHNINPRTGNAILGPTTRIIAGAPCMRDELLGCTFEISPTAFYQTNPAQTEVLYNLAIDGMDLRDGDMLLDAYCGSGTIGICAARAARERGINVALVGVERNAAGIADAVHNAALNDLEVVGGIEMTSPAEGASAEADATCKPAAASAAGSEPTAALPNPGQAAFVAEDATSYLQRAVSTGLRPDVIVLDPPRAGSTPAFLEAASAVQPRRIVYISCNPVTQVRDLELLATRGWRLALLTPVDMFPHTEHVETVAVLTRDAQ